MREFIAHPSRRRAFTLVELLVTITIIGMLSGLVFGALMMAREAARDAATKATIAKLNSIIMHRYEGYMTRRVPIRTQGLTPFQAAQNRLCAIRDLMRMEMPDRIQDVPTPLGAATAVGDPPIVLPNPVGGVPQRVPIPAIGLLYYNRLVANPPPSTSVQNGAAELLYMIVSMGSPEVMEQFSQSEIGDTNGNGYPEFIDGWGRPIFFLRWAPGFSPYSGVQAADAVRNHDPFDPRLAETSAYQLIPLIYSSGPNNDPRLNIKDGYHFGDTNHDYHGLIFSNNNSSEFLQIGSLLKNPDGTDDTHALGNITNHHIEQR
jgi:prepilin-type N-terminal cleavage/methylation domain-containing protein